MLFCWCAWRVSSAAGTVRVVVAEEEGVKKLAFIFPEGPSLPKPDREVVESTKKAVREAMIHAGLLN